MELIYSHKEGMKLVEIESPPSLEKGQVLIKPLSVAICGSDLFHLQHYKSDQLRLGHEWVGRVEAIGPEVSNVKEGDLVTSTAFWGCGSCEFCLSDRSNLCSDPVILSSEKLGAIRSWLVANSQNLNLIKADANKELVLIEVAAVGLEANRLTSGKGSLLIFGAGPVGLFSALVAKKLGLNPILVEVFRNRVEMGKNLGLETYLLPELLINPEFFHRFDMIIDATGDAGDNKGAFSFIPKFLKKGGEAVIVGKYGDNILLDMNKMNKLGASLKWMSGMSSGRIDEVAKLFAGDWNNIFDIMVTHEFPIEDSKAAFEVAKNKSECGKVVINIEEYK